MKTIGISVEGELVENVIIFECEKEDNRKKYLRLKKALDKEFEGYLKEDD